MIKLFPLVKRSATLVLFLSRPLALCLSFLAQAFPTDWFCECTSACASANVRSHPAPTLVRSFIFNFFLRSVKTVLSLLVPRKMIGYEYPMSVGNGSYECVFYYTSYGKCCRDKNYFLIFINCLLLTNRWKI